VTPTEHLNVVRRKLDSLLRLRELRPLGPKGEESYRALCDREQELLRALTRQPVPDWLARHEKAMHDHQAMHNSGATHDRQAMAPAWSEPPELVNEWPSMFAPPGRVDDANNGDGPWERMSEPSAVYWPFP
jgi:hypothetical protein